MTAEVAERAKTHVEISVEGMTCASCVTRIARAINGLDGVLNSRVDLISGRALVSYDPGRLDVREIRDAICSAGYSASEARPAGTTDSELDNPKPGRLTRETLHLLAVLAAAVVTMLISSVNALRFDGWGWLVGALASPVVLFSGWEIHRKGWAGLLRGRSSMDSLISLGTLTAWVWSAVIVVGGFDGHIYFDTATIIVAVLLLGRRVEGGAKRRAREAIAALARLESDSVRLPDGRDIPADELEIGMRFVVRPGERIAADGAVVEGSSAVDTSAMTGEATPAEAVPGSEVLGGTLNISGYLVVKATRVGSETALAQVKQLTEEALSRRAPIERHAERITTVFVPAVLVIAAVTLGVSLALRPAESAISATVAVLIAACPCALGLAIPAAFVAGSGRGAGMGVIIRGPDALESARRVDVVALDKTGTATEGRLGAVAVETVTGVDDAELLAIAAALEARSEHPAAKAVVEAARQANNAREVSHEPGLLSPGSERVGEHLAQRPAERSRDTNDEDKFGETAERVPLPEHRVPEKHIGVLLGSLEVLDFENLPGLGVRGRLRRTNGNRAQTTGGEGTQTAGARAQTVTDEGTQTAAGDCVEVAVGKPDLFEFVPDAVSLWAAQHAAEGRTVVLVGRGGTAEGLVALADRIRAGAGAAVKAWHEMGAEVVMLSGDGLEATRKTGEEIGTDRALGELSPGKKADQVRRLQAEGRCVAMVGDGINDAPALAAADLGVAMGSGTDVAQSASDLTLVSEDLRVAVDAMALARSTLQTIKGNLFWAFAYNTAILPVAALGLLIPEIAAVAMAFSSLFVLGNSLRLTHFRSMFEKKEEASKQGQDFDNKSPEEEGPEDSGNLSN